MKDINLSIALKVSLAHSKFKTVKELSHAAMVSELTLGKVSRGESNTKWSTINAISNALEISIIDFLRNGEVK